MEADLEFLSAAQAGDARAFEGLVNLYQDRVFQLAHRLTNSEADAAEILQDVFLSAFRALPDFRRESKFSTWLFRITTNHALMRLRQRKSHEQHEESLQSPRFNSRGSLVEEVASPQEDLDQKMMNAQLAKAVQEAAAALPSDFRTVFMLRDLEGLSYEEISEIVGDSVSAVKTRIHRARLAMRAALNPFLSSP